MIRLLFLLFLPYPLFAQTVVGTLSKDLKEVSGLVFVKDDMMAGINDSGNSPTLYFINLKGEIQHETKLKDAVNVDWEDIAFNGKDKIYIGDFGNNDNKRTDLCIYEVSLKDALKDDKVDAKKLKFEYPDQDKFPPKKKNLHFDCEAMAYYNDSLYLFTKSRAEPWDGMSYVYSIDPKDKNQKANLIGKLYVGKNGWWQDAITAVDIQDDVCYILTYNRLMKYNIANQKLTFDQWVYMKPITQKESFAVNSKGEIYVADEVQPGLGGGYLYKVVFPAKKKKKEKK